MSELQNPRTIPEAEFRRRSRRSFLTGAAAVAGGALSWRWIQNQPDDGNIPQVLRSGLERNETLWRGLHRENHLAPTFAASESSVLRVNGRHGIRSEIDLDAWRLRVLGPSGDQLDELTLAQVQELPRHEMIVEHKCIEGWSQITTWGGARFSDLAARYDVDENGPAYVSLVTPDEDYYVGLDIASALHPQTLLAWDMHGGPLDLDHGAPLRLATPVKYGIKQIKRIGTIQFTDQRPEDYWFERGYSWYAHL